jgi:hypothetical protein
LIELCYFWGNWNKEENFSCIAFNFLSMFLVGDDFFHRKVVQEGLRGKPTTLHCQGQENYNPSG